ncbi:hypothetical protein GCM10018953_06000 [Streptosporangium nondiastaticum]
MPTGPTGPTDRAGTHRRPGYPTSVTGTTPEHRTPAWRAATAAPARTGMTGVPPAHQGAAPARRPLRTRETPPRPGRGQRCMDSQIAVASRTPRVTAEAQCRTQAATPSGVPSR